MGSFTSSDCKNGRATYPQFRLGVVYPRITWDTRPTISKLWSPLAFGILGFSLAAGANFFARRPVMSGIQKHIALVCLGVPVGLFAQTKLDERFAKRDAEL